MNTPTRLSVTPIIREIIIDESARFELKIANGGGEMIIGGEKDSVARRVTSRRANLALSCQLFSAQDKWHTRGSNETSMDRLPVVELRFRSNPLKDYRLKKLIEQDKLKAVLEYVAKQWDEQQKLASTTAKPAQSKKVEERKKTEQVKDKIEILHFDSSWDLKGREITWLPRVIAVCPHILRNIDFATPDNLKEFLNLHVTIENDRRGKNIVGLEWTKRRDRTRSARQRSEVDLRASFLRPAVSRRRTPEKDQETQSTVQLAQVSRCWHSSLDCSSLHRYLTLLQDQVEFPYVTEADHYFSSDRRRRSTRYFEKDLSREVTIELGKCCSTICRSAKWGCTLSWSVNCRMAFNGLYWQLTVSITCCRSSESSVKWSI